MVAEIKDHIKSEVVTQRGGHNLKSMGTQNNTSKAPILNSNFELSSSTTQELVVAMTESEVLHFIDAHLIFFASAD